MRFSVHAEGMLLLPRRKVDLLTATAIPAAVRQCVNHLTAGVRFYRCLGRAKPKKPFVIASLVNGASPGEAKNWRRPTGRRLPRLTAVYIVHARLKRAYARDVPPSVREGGNRRERTAAGERQGESRVAI